MANGNPGSGLQLRSLIKASGELELSLAKVDIPDPAADEVLVRIEGTPINPSDLGLLLGAADMSTAAARPGPTLTATVPQPFMRAMAGRVDQSLPVGNEGSGLVIAAGSDPAAQALLGKTVAAIGGRCTPSTEPGWPPMCRSCRRARRPPTAPPATTICC